MKLKGKLSVYIVFFFLLFRAQVLSFTGEYEKKKATTSYYHVHAGLISLGTT